MAINPMPAPIDYMGMQPQIDPGRALLQGLQLGSAIRGIRQENEALALREQYKADLQKAMMSRNPQAWLDLAAMYPEQGQSFREQAAALGEQQQKNEFLIGAQALNALNRGDVAAARMIVDQQIEAAQNSGADVTGLKAIRASLDVDPSIVQGQLSAILSTINRENFKDLVAAPYLLAREMATTDEARAKAETAAVTARFAESQAAVDLAKAGWDIEQIQQNMGVQRANQEIAVLEAARKRTTDELQQRELELKISEAERKRDLAVRDAQFANESAYADLSVGLSNITSILQTPAQVIEAATGPVSQMFPTMSEETADFQEKINTLKSQTFMSQVQKMRGLGALTQSEGARLESLLGSLELRQSPEQLLSNIRTIESIMTAGSERYRGILGLPPQEPQQAQPAAQQEERPKGGRFPGGVFQPPQPQGTGEFRVLGVERQ